MAAPAVPPPTTTVSAYEGRADGSGLATGTSGTAGWPPSIGSPRRRDKRRGWPRRDRCRRMRRATTRRVRDGSEGSGGGGDRRGERNRRGDRGAVRPRGRTG